MKITERAEACALRSGGESIKAIARRLKVAPSSVSTWVRHVAITDQQRAKLYARNVNASHGSQALKLKGRERRLLSQREGRERARGGDLMFIAGCMLYWGEGWKNRHLLSFANADAAMIQVFIRFLQHMGVQQHDVRLQIHCYPDVHPVEEIESRWLRLTRLPKTCLMKTIVNSVSGASRRKRCGTLPYGTCQVRVSRTDVLQQILGGIQEVGGFERAEWVD